MKERLTVYQLIADLESLPWYCMDYQVRTEGCDCDGEVANVTIRPAEESWDNKPFVYFERPKGDYQ